MSGGVTAIGSSTEIGYFQGGGRTEDGKTLYELIGEKTIIGCKMLDTATDNISQFDGAFGNAFVNNAEYSIVDVPIETRNSITSFSVFGISYGVVNTSKTVDIYAICI